ncbi:putative phosphohistidine phosphatase SixA [Vibrio nigripulchritudo SOn1]|uniref:Phosphohistidine phosphatase SixA n=1 Tax=Vibrio nigripulchritudo SOn1 TaxID=1238450 RepID=A0AAV2VIV5_9VIBR|nr:phosphohistidine phosphatase SixA [Vibrio nigripulchritudo]CCO44344.1 putative phosphohistidine phosphatase SixA [Vibrio nigripulchritudo SOn1]
MKIFIMRHGEAETFADSDAERALTSRGVNQSVLVAKACAEQGESEMSKVLVSPYLRAQQTWNAIQQYFKTSDQETCKDITPYGKSDDVFEYVCALAVTQALDSVLLVSHLPLVGYLTAEFVPDMAPPMFPTSGLVCIDFNLEKRQGELLWHIHP